MRLDSPLLAIVGAGPKAAALVAKAAVLRQLELPSVRTVIIEAREPAAHWNGVHGFTHGRCELGTPPQKDVGYPYRSPQGPVADHEMLKYSWEAFLISNGSYSEWVDQGRPQPRHAAWGRYLSWVFAQAEGDILLGELTQILPTTSGRVKLSILPGPGAPGELEADGVVITGPGQPLILNGVPPSDRIFNGQNYWTKGLEWLATQEAGKVAVLGGGETAASVALSLIVDAPQVAVELITRHATIFTRGESFFENRLYSRPEEWFGIPAPFRDEFIKRTDRGVFSVAAMAELARANGIRILPGKVTRVEDLERYLKVTIDNSESRQYSAIIVALGFDAWSSFKLLPEEIRPAVWNGQESPERENERMDLLRQVDQFLRFPITHGQKFNLHMPMLAGLGQGPGFPNLSCLGTVADRVLACYVASQG